MGGRLRFDGALGEQIDLLLVGLGHHRADPVHHDLAFIGEDNLERRIESDGSAQFDRFREFREFRVDQRRDGIETAHLIGVVDDQFTHGVESTLHRLGGVLIGLEVVVGAGEEIAALAGLGILHLRD